MTTLQVRNSVNRSPLRRGFLLIPLSLLSTCFALLPMAQAVGPDTDGSIPGSNNGEGVGVLVSRTTGIWNTGTGFEALNHLTAGNQNTATGFRALFSDTSGGFNTATGVFSLFGNISGFFNSATGAYSLAHNTTASYNTANGYGALYSNTAGSNNAANGFAALYSNTTGFYNTANGIDALYYNTIGAYNTGIGSLALFGNTTGSGNTANGAQALSSNNGSNNTAVGYQALVNPDGSFNTALGKSAGSGVTTANNVIAIGANVSGENVSDTCYIGNIFGVTSAGATAVYVNSLGKLGTVVSSQRFKEEIEPMNKASEAILALKPVTFRYKEEIDPAGTPQFGLVAEDVEKVNPDLVVRDGEGKVNTVRYEAVNAMLLNEFIKEHRKVEEQQATIGQLKSNAAKQEATISELKRDLGVLTAQLKEQAAQIRNVSAQIEVSKLATKVVVNNP